MIWEFKGTLNIISKKLPVAVKGAVRVIQGVTTYAGPYPKLFLIYEKTFPYFYQVLNMRTADG